MFTFPESDYKWCPQCAGNIRKEATYCRFCKKPITNKLMMNTLFSPFMTMDDVAMWMPGFNTLVTKISSDLRNRFELADIDSPQEMIGVPEGLTAMEHRIQSRDNPQGFCSPEPPTPHELGLIYDMLLSMHENGESLVEICQYPHLKLLEITPQEVAAECELRKAEFQKNHKCVYCAEYVFPDDEECRFCGGTADKRPKATDRLINNEVIDTQFLKEIILYESAARTISGTTPIAQEILDTNGITQETLDQEILRQRGSLAIAPMPRFYKRMHELNLTSCFSPESLSISAIVDLGSALDKKKVARYDEAMIVYEHGLNRTEGNDELMHERGRLLDYMGLLFQGQDDYVQYKKYHEMAKECKTFGMSDEMKEMMNQSDLLMLADHSDVGDDPEKRLANLNKMLGGSNELLSNLASEASSAVPGLGEALSAFGSVVDGTMQSTRITLEAEVAKKKGDLAEAERKYAEAFALCGDDWMGASNKSGILISLAEVKHLQGDDTTAEATLDEALKCATDYAEAMPDLGNFYLGQTHLATACFQRDTGKHVESENSFRLALKLDEESVSEMLQKYGGDKEQYSGGTSGIKEQYAKLLRILERNEDAEKLEREAEQLRIEADQWTAKVKLHKSKIAEQMRED